MLTPKRQNDIDVELIAILIRLDELAEEINCAIPGANVVGNPWNLACTALNNIERLRWAVREEGHHRH